MNFDWKVLTEEEKLIFVEIQRMFSKETFDSSKIILEKTALTFYLDTWLVKATILPQDVHMADGESITIDERCESLFLYNPETSELSKKIISLNRKSETIYLINTILGLKLTEANVVKYVKFFGLCVHEEPFYFMENTNEISWKENIEESQKERLLGAIEAFCPIEENGVIDVGLKENNQRIGKTFGLSMPCIYQDACYLSKMSVAENGLIVMEEDQPLTDKSITPVTSQLPYYVINATQDFRNEANKIRRKFFLTVIGIQIPVFLSAVVLILMILAMVVDWFLLAIGGEYTGKLNSWLSSSAKLLSVVVICSTIVFLLRVYRTLLFEYMEFIGHNKPHAYSYLLGNYSEKLRNKWGTQSARVRGVLFELLFGVLELVFTASVILFSVHHSITPLYKGVEDVNIGLYPVLVVDYFVGIVSIEGISSSVGLSALIGIEYNLYGVLLLSFFSIFLSLVVVREAVRVWRLTKGGKS